MSTTSLRILNRPIISVLNNHLIDYPTPVNINYLWNFGSIAGVFLVVQIITNNSKVPRINFPLSFSCKI